MEGAKLRVARPFNTCASLKQMFQVRRVEEFPDSNVDTIAETQFSKEGQELQTKVNEEVGENEEDEGVRVADKGEDQQIET
jgi:hypothetical protein